MPTTKNKAPNAASPPAHVDDLLSVTLRADNGYEYNILLPRSVVADIFDPETPTRFVEIPAATGAGQSIRDTKRFLNTLYIKEIDVKGW